MTPAVRNSNEAKMMMVPFTNFGMNGNVTSVAVVHTVPKQGDQVDIDAKPVSAAKHLMDLRVITSKV